ncbi:hypothetical protein [uncultured Fibrobacter sp.]|uniref:hypothetical protein n=1 Tax=uncultured Fibrobacter sp. TaxID=261512 RepID=UPI002620ACE5|nr:hypothetical protein [uncultured Fibrobacter sp.]
MATKEVMIVTPEDMKNLVPSEKAMDAYRFALANAGIEMDEETAADFVVRRNLKTEGFRELAEIGKWMEKTAASIKEALKHTYNVGTEEDLPSNVKWSKQSYTYAFVQDAGAAVANVLVAKRLVAKDQLLALVTVTAMAKASGLTTEKLVDMFPDTIEQKPKERTLSVK